MSDKYVKFDIPKWMNWLARDSSGALYGYLKKPRKCTDSWGIGQYVMDVPNSHFITEDPTHYPQVKWSDEEPKPFKDGITLTSEPSDFVDPVTVDGIPRTPPETQFNEYYMQNEDGTISYTRVEVPKVDTIQNETPDMVNTPPHYKQYSFEPIDIITEVVKEYPPEIGFHIGTTLKYLFRSPFKGKQEEDLQKAEYYLTRAIKGLSE